MDLEIKKLEGFKYDSRYKTTSSNSSGESTLMFWLNSKTPSLTVSDFTLGISVIDSGSFGEMVQLKNNDKTSKNDRLILMGAE